MFTWNHLHSSLQWVNQHIRLQLLNKAGKISHSLRDITISEKKQRLTISGLVTRFKHHPLLSQTITSPIHTIIQQPPLVNLQSGSSSRLAVQLEIASHHLKPSQSSAAMHSKYSRCVTSRSIRQRCFRRSKAAKDLLRETGSQIQWINWYLYCSSNLSSRKHRLLLQWERRWPISNNSRMNS